MPEQSTTSTLPTEFDVAVIGAGSAGFSAAITAADAGAKVALIGYGTIGGTCVNVGCVPSKAMIRAVEPLHVSRAAERFDGITASASVTDWKALVRQKQALVDDLRQAKYLDVLPNYDAVSYLEGKAQFKADGTLMVGDMQIAATKIIIATGSRPHVPDIDGLSGVAWLDSTSALELVELPESLMVMGGGYIGVELAQMFARAGCKVTIVTRRGLLPDAEPEISEALRGYFAGEGITVLSGLSYDSLREADGQVTLSAGYQGQSIEISAQNLLLATGRVPNTEGLALEMAGIATDATGAVMVDAMMRSSRDGVYAAGDVTGRDQFVYMAAYGAKLAAKNAMNGDTLPYDNAAMPGVVFSDPQVASVGLTEAAARARGFDAATSVLGLEHVPRALAARDTRGLIKLVAERGSKKLLGAHILAPEGADSIQTAAMAISAGLTYEQLGDMIFPYLTTVEGLKLAAQTFEKDVSKLSCCAG
ncbi:mercury(II) reductase [Candidatus Halocynthiibacter alkanivorans]|uniref:mercury(II) reductase n=1 Tax=Candidatus Halocynthiibacter alkanivorans TaxID=2267619 RepID=UPI000DF2C912|nr:mercury(II) reductase [Candidatus Halocynthiibacter alkanivorans]